MSYANKGSWDYINTSTDLAVGNGLKQDSTEGRCDLAGATTDIPLGVAVEAVTKAPASTGPFNSVSVETVCGKQVKMISGSGGVAINVLVTATTNGQFIAATKGGTQTQTDFCWGRSIAAVSNQAEVFAAVFNWFEMEIT